MGRKAIAVIGLGYGDEGKGSVVDFLSHRYRADVVRFNGGPQAAHHVVLSSGEWHCFSQIGSGAFNGSSTFLHKGMLIDPLALQVEYEVLRKKTSPPPIYIHPECLIVTPYHKFAGRAKALATGRSTTGRGVGCARDYYESSFDFRFEDLYSRRLIEDNLDRIKCWAFDEIAKYVECKTLEKLEPILKITSDTQIKDLADLYQEFVFQLGKLWRPWTPDMMRPVVILEGSQGALLDRSFGDKPHVSPVTTRIPPQLLEDLGVDDLLTVGVTRTYITRHGAGPLATENDYLRNALIETHNKDNKWQGEFRVGWPDLVALRRGSTICGRVDALFITHVDKTDRLTDALVCDYYRPHGEPHYIRQKPKELPTYLAAKLKLPLFGCSYGPRKEDKT